MRTALPLLVAAAALAGSVAGCGGDTSAGPTTATTASMTTRPATTEAPTSSASSTTGEAPATTLTVFLVRNDRIAPTRVVVGGTRAVAHAALNALAAPPADGYTTAVGSAGEPAVAISGGTAEVDWPQAELSHLAAAQVVYTLTQFPTVRRVRLPDGTLAQRRDFEDVTPPILVESPLPGETVGSPVTVTGTASVYEATLVVELVHDGAVVQKHVVTASTGAPYRGTFSTTFPTRQTGPATIVAFSPSAADGSEQHRVDVPVEIR